MKSRITAFIENTYLKIQRTRREHYASPALGTHNFKINQTDRLMINDNIYDDDKYLTIRETNHLMSCISDTDITIQSKTVIAGVCGTRRKCRISVL